MYYYHSDYRECYIFSPIYNLYTLYHYDSITEGFIIFSSEKVWILESKLEVRPFLGPFLDFLRLFFYILTSKKLTWVRRGLKKSLEEFSEVNKWTLLFQSSYRGEMSVAVHHSSRPHKPRPARRSSLFPPGSPGGSRADLTGDDYHNVDIICPRGMVKVFL